MTDPKLQMARRVADSKWTIGSTEWIAARNAALAAIEECTDRAAKLAEWAHMVPPDGGSPTDEEVALAALIASSLRSGDHLKGPTDG